MNLFYISWKQFLIGCLAVMLSFALISAAFVQRKKASNHSRFINHGIIITDTVWTFQKEALQTYLQLAVEANHYKYLIVLEKNGSQYIEVTAQPLSFPDTLLCPLGIIPLNSMSTDIVYQEEVIGTLKGQQYSRICYPLATIFLSLFLFMIMILFIINLISSSKFLGQEVERENEKFRASERRFQELVDLLPETVCEIDPQGLLTYINEIGQKRFSPAKQGHHASSFFNFFMPEERERIQESFTSVIQGGKQKLTKVLARTEASTPSPVLLRLAPCYSGKTISGLRAILFDITEQHQLEEQLRRAQRMEAIGLMAGGVAHDLNNILSGIVNYPELILMKLPPDSNVRDNVLALKKSGQRAAEVVADMLTVSRGIAAPKEIRSPNALIDEYLQSPEFSKLQSLHPDVAWKVKLDKDTPNISCSRNHVLKSIMNLITNGAEAAADSGEVTISTEKREDKAGKWWSVIIISDTGSGINADDQQHIFEPFYTKKMMGRSGTGLGLTIVANTMQDHGGKIRLNSSEDGSSFALFFPTLKQVQDVLADDIDKGEIQQGKGEKILIIDDDTTQRDIASQLLLSLGYQVVSVASGEEAVQYLRTRCVHLLLLDMIMEPGMSGFETYKQVVAIHPKQKAVIASGFSESNEVKNTMSLGAQGFIKKPYTLEQLAQIVYSTLKQANK